MCEEGSIGTIKNLKTTMKLKNWTAVLPVVAFLLTACMGPAVVRETLPVTQPQAIERLLVVVDAKVFYGPAFGNKGAWYAGALGQALENAGNTAHIRTTLVQVDPMQLQNKFSAEFIAQRPTHVIRVYPVSVTATLGHPPNSAVWQLDLSEAKPTVTSSAEVDGHNVVRQTVSLRPVYRLQVSAPTCLGLLTTEDSVQQCGRDLADTFIARLQSARLLRAAQPQ